MTQNKSIFLRFHLSQEEKNWIEKICTRRGVVAVENLIVACKIVKLIYWRSGGKLGAISNRCFRMLLTEPNGLSGRKLEIHNG